MKLLLAVLIVAFLILPFGSLAFAQTTEIIVSEFAAVTEGTLDSPDWVEIYNSGGHTITLDGWSIKDATETNKILLTGCIKPSNFRKFNFYTNRLNNGGDKIRLFDENGVLIEEIEYFSNDIPPHQKGESSQRNLETNTWQVGNPNPTNSVCSENTNNSAQITAVLALSEIYPSPDKGGQEWVEIFNPNKSSVETSGWFLQDRANHKKTLSGPIPAKSYKAFYFSSGWLNNSGDKVSLFNPLGKLVESYTFDKVGSESSFAKDTLGKWRQTNTPTPNNQNKITGIGQKVSSTLANSEQNISSDSIEATGLQPTVDFVNDALQFDTIDSPEPLAESGKIAGVSNTNSKNTLSTLLISAGFAFLAVALAWPFLEKYKIV